MNHVASDIAGATGDQDRHAGGPLISPGVAGSGVGNICLDVCMHVFARADNSVHKIRRLRARRGSRNASCEG
jgi:hypothetical protein